MEALIARRDREPIYGDIYTLPGLKVLLDDALREYLVASGYAHSTLCLDVWLAIGLLSLVLAGGVALISTYCDFYTTRRTVAWMLHTYVAANLVSLVITRIEGGRAVYGPVSVTSRIADMRSYVLLVYHRDRIVPAKYTRSIFDLFDSDGRLDHRLFFADLRTLFAELRAAPADRQKLQ